MVIRERGSLWDEVVRAADPTRVPYPTVLTLIAHTAKPEEDSNLSEWGFRRWEMVTEFAARAASKWYEQGFSLYPHYRVPPRQPDGRVVEVVAMLAGPATKDYHERFGHKVNLHYVYANLIAWRDRTEAKWVDVSREAEVGAVDQLAGQTRIVYGYDEQGYNRISRLEQYQVVSALPKHVYVDIEAFVRMGMKRAVGFFTQDSFIEHPTLFELWEP